MLATRPTIVAGVQPRLALRLVRWLVGTSAGWMIITLSLLAAYRLLVRWP